MQIIEDSNMQIIESSGKAKFIAKSFKPQFTDETRTVGPAYVCRPSIKGIVYLTNVFNVYLAPFRIRENRCLSRLSFLNLQAYLACVFNSRNYSNITALGPGTPSAFDQVPSIALLSKLFPMKFPEYIKALIASYLKYPTHPRYQVSSKLGPIFYLHYLGLSFTPRYSILQLANLQ